MALTDEQLEIISETLTPLFQHLEKEVIADVARRIKKTLTYSRTAELQAMSMRELGYSPAKIRKEAMKLLNSNKDFRKAVAKNTLEYKRDIRKLINDITKEAYKANNDIVAGAGNMSWIDDLSVWKNAGKELGDNSFLQQLVDSFSAQTEGALKNMMQSTGFKTMNGFEAVESLYKRELDKAAIKICSGTFSVDKVVSDTVHSLAQSGLRTIDFSSGYSMQLDTAARLALRTGCHQLAAKVMDKNMEQSGENLVYVSKHWGARNTGAGHANHEQWQGKVYFIKDGINYSEEAERIGQDRIMNLWYATGYSADGERENDPLGLNGYNCRHHHYVWFEGVSELPKETPEPKPVTINGKTYDYYAATQKMRSMERDIRALKREKEALSKLGMDTKEIQSKMRKKTSEYHQFCKDVGINAKDNRLRYEVATSNVRKTATWKSYETIVNMARSGIIKEGIMNRARTIKTEVDLLKVSSSKVIEMGSIEDIKTYFKGTYGIEVEGFDKKDLFDVKATLSGYDDILTEFPEAVRKIKKIKYNSHLGNYGNINNKGLSEIGPLGLRDYGTGVHEATHAYDMAMSQYGKHDFSESVVEQARKNLKLRKGTKKYKALLVQVTGDYAYIDKALEVFAYAVETAKGGVNNMFATEVYRIIGGKQ